MTEISCNYSGDRDAAIVAFLYDDADESLAERARFMAGSCRLCRCDGTMLSVGPDERDAEGAFFHVGTQKGLSRPWPASCADAFSC